MVERKKEIPDIILHREKKALLLLLSHLIIVFLLRLHTLSFILCSQLKVSACEK